MLFNDLDVCEDFQSSRWDYLEDESRQLVFFFLILSLLIEGGSSVWEKFVGGWFQFSPSWMGLLGDQFEGGELGLTVSCELSWSDKCVLLGGWSVLFGKNECCDMINSTWNSTWGFQRSFLKIFFGAVYGLSWNAGSAVVSFWLMSLEDKFEVSKQLTLDWRSYYEERCPVATTQLLDELSGAPVGCKFTTSRQHCEIKSETFHSSVTVSFKATWWLFTLLSQWWLTVRYSIHDKTNAKNYICLFDCVHCVILQIPIQMKWRAEHSYCKLCLLCRLMTIHLFVCFCIMNPTV